MGDEVLVHLVGETIPGAEVTFIDTGLHFPETLGTRDAYAANGTIALRTITPLLTVAEQVQRLSLIHISEPTRPY